MITLHHLANIDCIVRTRSLNATELYHLLEDEATGLMVPLVGTPRDAALIARAGKFPPIGQRRDIHLEIGVKRAGTAEQSCTGNEDFIVPETAKRPNPVISYAN